MSGLDEHPPSPNLLGEVGIVSVILASLMANPAVWERTVVFVTYDENGGFFDHVPPPVSPPGTPGEWLTAPATVGDAGGVHGPVGLGFRVPLLVLSPYSVGGRICSDVADHTSLLRFIETRFGVRVPNLSAWRRSVTGDLTGALSFSGGAGKVSPSLVPRLALAGAGHAGQVATECPSTLSSLIFNPPAYPVPPNGPTVQERGTRPHVSAARGCAV
jgi:phospholipase C